MIMSILFQVEYNNSWIPLFESFWIYLNGRIIKLLRFLKEEKEKDIYNIMISILTIIKNREVMQDRIEIQGS